MRLSFGRSNETRWTFALVVAGVFGALQLVGHFHHELWRDELDCFGVGRHAKGLWDLLTGSRRYSGHPFLWYYLLHLLAQIDRSYLWLHVVTWTVAVGGALLWLRYAPVPRALRVLALGSYYLAYEYAVICRSYALGVFLTFACCAIYRADRVRYVPLAAVLVLLAATSAYGFALALALSIFVFTHGPSLVTAAEPARGKRVAVPMPWIAGIAVLGAGFAFVVLTSLPPADGIWQPPTDVHITGATARDAAVQYWRAMFPFRGPLDWSWTGGDYLGSRWSSVQPFVPWAGAIWLAAWLFALRRSPRAAIAYGIGTLLFALIHIRVYSGAGWRHVGHNFVLLVACIWLHARDRARPPRARLAHTMLVANLAVQVITAAAAFAVDYRGQFSRAAEVAQVIRDRHLENLPIVADSDSIASPIAIMLDRAFLYPATGQVAQAPTYSWYRSAVANKDLVRDADRLARESDGQALVIVSADHEAIEKPGIDAHLVWQSGDSLVGDETYRVYQVRSR